MTEMIRVLVADDHGLVRNGICKLVSAAPDMEVIADYPNGAEALEGIQRLKPDIALLDISMPRLGGLGVLAELRRQRIKLPVIMISMHADPESVREVLRLGGGGFVPKEAEPDELYHAVRTVVSGGRYFSPTLVQNLVQFEHEADRSSSGEPHLSARQTQVLDLIGKGKSVSEIAQILGVGNKTVETHRQRLMQHLGLQNSRELVRYAIRRSQDPMYG